MIHFSNLCNYAYSVRFFFYGLGLFSALSLCNIAMQTAISGAWLLFWPCGWGLGMAAAPGTFPDPFLLATFATGALVMRGAGCTINDMWDRKIDQAVERTKDRPLASGQVGLSTHLSLN